MAQRPAEPIHSELAFEDQAEMTQTTLRAQQRSESRGVTLVAILLMLPFVAILVFPELATYSISWAS